MVGTAPAHRAKVLMRYWGRGNAKYAKYTKNRQLQVSKLFSAIAGCGPPVSGSKVGPSRAAPHKWAKMILKALGVLHQNVGLKIQTTGIRAFCLFLGSSRVNPPQNPTPPGAGMVVAELLFPSSVIPSHSLTRQKQRTELLVSFLGGSLAEYTRTRQI